MPDFLMPSLGADMEAGTLVAFRKRPGDAVARGDILAEVETDKGIIEIECFHAGTLGELLVSPGTKVPVGTRLATIVEGAVRPQAEAAPQPREGARVPEVGTAVRAAAEPLSAPPPPPASTQGPAPRATPAARRRMRELGVDALHARAPARLDAARALEGVITRMDVDEPAGTGAVTAAGTASGTAIEPAPRTAEPAATRPRVSPLARRTAAELGVSLADLRGSGPDGAVVAEDVRRAAQQSPAPTPELSPEARMRAAIATAMARSKREIPHYYLSQTVDLGSALAWLQAENERRSVDERLLLGTLLLHAVVRGIKRAPELNAHYVDGKLMTRSEVHLGVAVALRGGGLIAPAIQAADALSLDELNRRFKDLVARARSGRLKSSEMASATLTVTSLGERGSESVYPVIVPPQVAIVGFGAPSERPWVVAGAVVARPTVIMTLAADHRVSDGHRGSLFLGAVQTILEENPA